MKNVFIIGNLGANAIRRTTSEGRELMTFSVAVNDRQGTTWFNCVGSFREKQFPYLERGAMVAVAGDLTVNTYNGQPDLSVNIDRLELCGNGKSSQQQEGAGEDSKIE